MHIRSIITGIYVMVLLLITNSIFAQSYARSGGIAFRLTANNDTVKVGSYFAITETGDSISPKYTEYFVYSQACRIRQTCNIAKLRFYCNGSEIDSMYIKFWRYASTNNYTLIGTTENLKNQLQNTGSISECILSTPIAVNEGDFYSILIYNDDSIKAMIMVSNQYNKLYYVSNEETSGTYAWGTKDYYAYYIPIEFYTSPAPIFVAVGNSLIAGINVSQSYINPNSVVVSDTVIPNKLSEYLGYSYQNMGQSGDQTGNIITRLKADAIDLKPRLVILNSGVNDVAVNKTLNTIISNYTTILDSLYVNNIRVAVLGIFSWTNGTNAQMQRIDSINTRLETLVEGYNKFSFINVNSYIGQFREGGDDNNYWDIIPIYSGDGLHLSEAGYKKVAEVIYNTIR